MRLTITRTRNVFLGDHGEYISEEWKKPGPIECDCGHIEGVHWENGCQYGYHGGVSCDCKIIFPQTYRMDIRGNRHKA